MNFLIIVVAQAAIARGITIATVYNGNCSLEHSLKSCTVICHYTTHMTSSASHGIIEHQRVYHKSVRGRIEKTALDICSLNSHFARQSLKQRVEDQGIVFLFDASEDSEVILATSVLKSWDSL